MLIRMLESFCPHKAKKNFSSRENLSSSPSEMSPTSCSPSSSDTIQSARRTNNNNTSSNNNNSSNSTANANNLRTNGHLQQQSRSANGNTVQNGNADTGNENGLNRQTSGNESYEDIEIHILKIEMNKQFANSPIDVTGVSSLLSNHPLKQGKCSILNATNFVAILQR
ncbi:unnamed protein product [Anisakis simplex]|uniref:Serine/threonine-protein kinase DDB_G0282963 n=1 Tax=Anisakis simplex TaxID=6269 RepID=A0A0M3J7S9_ANISI|nr:unnamed protein product [Anisakis simplex]